MSVCSVHWPLLLVLLGWSTGGGAFVPASGTLCLLRPLAGQESIGRQFLMELWKLLVVLQLMLLSTKLHGIVDCGTCSCCFRHGNISTLHDRIDDAQDRKELFTQSLLAVLFRVPLAPRVALATRFTCTVGLLAVATASLHLHCACGHG